MDVFLIAGGIVQNIICIDSLELAKILFPEFTVVERTEENQQIQIGEVWP